MSAFFCGSCVSAACIEAGIMRAAALLLYHKKIILAARDVSGIDLRFSNGKINQKQIETGF